LFCYDTKNFYSGLTKFFTILLYLIRKRSWTERADIFVLFSKTPFGEPHSYFFFAAHSQQRHSYNTRYSGGAFPAGKPSWMVVL
jgi:hypothetical protein